jgi:nicotinamide phosphoribosyltransferase
MRSYNPILNTDSYKPSHWLQMPPGSEYQHSYIESRGGTYDKTVFFGLQAFLKQYMSVPITLQDIYEAEEFLTQHGEPFNKAGWIRLLEKRNGVYPIRIRAVKEGTVVPIRNVLVTAENTDPEFAWMTSYVETPLLRSVWYPTTVATISFSIKQVIKAYLEETGDPAGLPFKLHDFGARGVSSFESAGLGGAAHLVNFMGSDTISGIIALQRYYNAKTMPAFSIPASEHSTITSWGRENEIDAYRNMITQFGKPNALFACVSDSYDIINACRLWGTMKDELIASGGTLVVRPDSGHPETVVLEVVRKLDEEFGSTVNAKGYKVLNTVRVIQGDGINEQSIRGILMNLKFAGYSADNVAFGMGGALLQQMNRDTQQFAMKCSAIQVNGKWIDVYKDPVGDAGKKSKRGRLTLIRDRMGKGDRFMTIRIEELKAYEDTSDWREVMETVWENGVLLRDQSIDEIRNNAA